MRQESFVPFLQFIEQNPTPWHFHQTVARLPDLDPLPAHPAAGKKYLFQKSGLIAGIVTPVDFEASLCTLKIYACHTDSPCLKVKPQGLYNQCNQTWLALEVYGAPILASWIGRRLSLTGVLWIEDEDGAVEEKLLPPSGALQAIIPNLAIHFDRSVNDEGLRVNKQEGLAAMVSSGVEYATFEELFRPLFPRMKRVVFHDLFLVPSEPPSALDRGEASDIISPRLDNLSSCWALYQAFHEAKPQQSGATSMFLFLNHEEVGSETSEGAYSSAITDLLDVLLSGIDPAARLAVKARSSIISCDAAHATHPLFLGKHDPLHRVSLGKGVVLKLNSQQRYSTLPRKIAEWISLFDAQSIPYQLFSARNDIPCGTTLGPILSSRLGIAAIDIGAPLLGMHAALEVASWHDIQLLKKVASGFTD